ncbi:alpha/beta fold hydrolase [Hoeflea prorocentri]|uniref:Alpha/beta hydrolase n=1 Tax=Hoeflea prorocentri TaxID=1922333 RepID=A0A9X3UGS4_9HYPH|nr:alpha/beta hydrolase [Hoeflea prorocentri]MCY6380349.1 alpha/beta hydrolase [Hoeflea prorocentri]MDA5398149.1 alpha/beta hydrolase [Hoeflea prorocentri]
MEFESAVFEDETRRLHYVSMGDHDKPLMLCLHGFPEYWGAWRDIMPHLARTFRVVAPDQRGFGRSFKPEGVEAYQTWHLVKDINALADYLSPDEPFVLFGHDWGSAVAYAYAFGRPERLRALVVANGVHPHTFQKAIIDDPRQRAASQYMRFLRSEGAAATMRENDFARTLNMIAGFSKADWMSNEDRKAYLEAWGGDGTMEAMLNWYRASPVVVPPVSQPAEEVAEKVPVYDISPEAMTVRVPHLVVWGEDDEALRPVCLEGLERFAGDLTVERISGSGHWVLHEQPQRVADAVKQWLSSRSL